MNLHGPQPPLCVMATIYYLALKSSLQTLSSPHRLLRTPSSPTPRKSLHRPPPHCKPDQLLQPAVPGTARRPQKILPNHGLCLILSYAEAVTPPATTYRTMAAACRFAAPLGLAPLPRSRASAGAKSITFSIGSAKVAPRSVVMKAANETTETVSPPYCTGVGRQIIERAEEIFVSTQVEETSGPHSYKDLKRNMNLLQQFGILSSGATAWLSFAQSAQASEGVKLNMVYEVGELFELGIQLSYLLILLGLLGTGTFFVIRQVLVRRELDLSAKDLQEQVRSGEGSATELFELGAVMLRRKFYPAAIKYLQQAIQKWDRDEQDLAQVYNALGVSYKRENKLEKAIKQFEKAVELQPGYVTAWNNLGDAYEQQKDLKSALRAFEEVLLFDPNNKVARPRRDDLKSRVGMYKGVPVKTTDKR